MKHLVKAFAAIVLFASVLSAAISVTEVKFTGTDPNYSVSYRLNVAATSVFIKIKNSSGNVVATMSGTTTVGVNTVNWDATGFPTDTYSAIVTANAASVSSYTTLFTKTTADTVSFASPTSRAMSVAVNKNKQSKYYGRIFIGDRCDGNTSSLSVKIHVFANDGTWLSTYVTGPFGPTATTPFEMVVGEDSYLYIVDRGSASGGQIIRYASDFSDSLVIANRTALTTGLGTNGYFNKGIAVTGSGSSVKVYVTNSSDRKVAIINATGINTFGAPAYYNVAALGAQWAGAAAKSDNSELYAFTGNATLTTPTAAPSIFKFTSTDNGATWSQQSSFGTGQGTLRNTFYGRITSDNTYIYASRQISSTGCATSMIVKLRTSDGVVVDSSYTSTTAPLFLDLDAKDNILVCHGVGASAGNSVRLIAPPDGGSSDATETPTDFKANHTLSGSLNTSVSILGSTTGEDYSFRIGSGTSETPVTVNFASLTGSDDLTGSVTASAPTHPVVNASKVMNRYWTISAGASITSFSATLQIRYLESEIPSGVAEEAMIAVRWNGSSWESPSQTINTSTNTITITDVVEFSDWAIGDNGALPVQFSSMTASSRRNGAVIAWETVSELNCYGFDIERREVPSLGWQKVGFITGAGTSSSGRAYSFHDYAAPGRYVYRLKQIDKDGSFQFFGSAEVEIGALPKELSLNNYPNPFNPMTTIEFSVPGDGRALVRVFNIAGQEVSRLFEGVASAGRLYSVQFNATSLGSGVYFYSLESGSQRVVKRMMMIK